jgi:putative transposase
VSRYIDEYRGRFGVEPICRVHDVSASVYYQRATGQRSACVIDDERLLGVIKTTHEANYVAYGVSQDLAGTRPRQRGRRS